MKPRIPALAAVAAALLLTLSACSSSSGSVPDAPHSADSAKASPEELSGAMMDSGADSAESAPAGESIIRSGWISIKVDDPAASASAVSSVAEQLGGRVEASTIDRATEDSGASASLTIRVPSKRMDEAFEQLGAVGEVQSQNLSAVDVTAEHVDLQARVQALETSVKRLNELMAQASSTSDLLKAESALSARQQELDGLKAQLKALEDQVDDATIEVSLSSESLLPGGPDTFWDGLLAGLGSIAAAAAGALVVLGVVLPWLVLLGGITLVVVLVVRARRRKRQG